MTVEAPADTATRLERLPRFPLGVFPTPLEHLENLSNELDIDVWMKRDDLTGLALGGNKVRKLEFLLGYALETGADTIITTGGTQSNHARLTAAACRRAGLRCRLVLDRGRHPENGNLLLDRLFGAEIEVIEDPNPEVAAQRMQVVAGEMRQEGRKPFVIPRGGSIPHGAIGYLNMVLELESQLGPSNVRPEYVYVATGSCGTHSGIMAGRATVQGKWILQGISVSHPTNVKPGKIENVANETLSLLGLAIKVDKQEIRVDDRFVGEGYGSPTPQTWEAIQLLALLEGIVADPVYTGKALAGLVAHARAGLIPKQTKVIFVHTGGAPTLFAYESEIPGRQAVEACSPGF